MVSLGYISNTETCPCRDENILAKNRNCMYTFREILIFFTLKGLGNVWKSGG